MKLGPLPKWTLVSLCSQRLWPWDSGFTLVRFVWLFLGRILPKQLRKNLSIWYLITRALRNNPVGQFSKHLSSYPSAFSYQFSVYQTWPYSLSVNLHFSMWDLDTIPFLYWRLFPPIARVLKYICSCQFNYFLALALFVFYSSGG